MMNDFDCLRKLHAKLYLRSEACLSIRTYSSTGDGQVFFHQLEGEGGGQHSTPPNSWENHATMSRDAESMICQKGTEQNEAV